MAKSVAVVTGAAGDIGRAIASRLAASHDVVVLADIDETAVNTAAVSLGSGDIFVPVVCDVTDEASINALASAVQQFGVTKTLVNNAGAARAVSLHDTDAAIWRQDNALNLEAAFLTFRALENQLKQSQGAVINIASVNGMAVFGHPAYSAAKAGLIHLTRLIAVEYGKFGIRANAVAPGTVRTQAWEARAAVILPCSKRPSAGMPCNGSRRRRMLQMRCFSGWRSGCCHYRRLPSRRLWVDGRPKRTCADIFTVRALLILHPFRPQGEPS